MRRLTMWTATAVLFVVGIVFLLSVLGEFLAHRDVKPLGKRLSQGVLSSDGALLAISRNDGAVDVVTTETNETLLRVRGHGSAIQAVGFVNNGMTIVTIDQNGNSIRTSLSNANLLERVHGESALSILEENAWRKALRPSADEARKQKHLMASVMSGRSSLNGSRGVLPTGIKPEASVVFRDCRECPLLKVVELVNQNQDLTNSPQRYSAVGVYEVTVAEFAHFVSRSGYIASNGCERALGRDSEISARGALNWSSPGFSQTPDHPVVCVSWYDAMAYTNWLSDATSTEYSLMPTNDWLSVAALRQDLVACDDQDDELHVFNFGCDVSHEHTASAGSYPSDVSGLFDLHGNVFEWTRDCATAFGPLEIIDDMINHTPSCGTRTVIGGSWASQISEAGFEQVTGFGSQRSRNDIGFRVTRSVLAD